MKFVTQAIEYYSAKNDPVFKIYLTKMQELMSNEMTQVLIKSKYEEKSQTSTKKAYMSIIDMY